MPEDGALSAGGRPRALQILTEGGQLVVHDLQQWAPQPLTLPAQELPPITCARLVPTVGAAQAAAAAALSPRGPASLAASPTPGREGEAPPPSSSSAGAGTGAPAPPQHALTLDKVRACSRRMQAPGGGPAPEPTLLDHWPFRGGEPAASLAAAAGEGGGGGAAGRHPSALYFSGHRDGRVRVWDATTAVPELLLTIPAAAGQERLRAVTALEVRAARGGGVRGAAALWFRLMHSWRRKSAWSRPGRMRRLHALPSPPTAQVCPFSGCVLVGHAGGDARLYQFTETPQQARRAGPGSQQGGAELGAGAALCRWQVAAPCLHQWISHACCCRPAGAPH